MVELWMILCWTAFALALYAITMPRTRPAPARLPVSIDYDYEQAYNAYRNNYEAAYAQYQSNYDHAALDEARFQLFSARMRSWTRRRALRHSTAMTAKAYALLLTVLSVGCSSSSPTAPTPAPAVVPVVVAPVVPPVAVAPVAPPVASVDPILSDPRYSASFYRDFALGASIGGPYPLRRQTQPPWIYLRTEDDAGKPIDAYTLNETAAALINTAGKLTGVFGLAGLEQGTGTREGQAGWITVRWSDQPSQYCGFGYYAGDLMILYPKTAGCRCSGGPQVRMRTVKHELGHVLGFYHTDSPIDLMYHQAPACDQDPSPREVFHAAVAYGRPVGSLDPR